MTKVRLYILLAMVMLGTTGIATNDTLSLSSGYSNDIYYSLKNGVVKEITRSGWDLGFYTNAFSAGIIINEGHGVKLFSYPNGDTSHWAKVDTTGINTWKPLYNNPEIWEEGAFNKNALGHPDYGWGIYNMVTHSLTGDSLYVIYNPDFGYKKLWIVSKISVDNKYIIRFADLDGNNQFTEEIDVTPYINKNFLYYSLNSRELFDIEPDNPWDLLFTKYIDSTENMSGGKVEYLVTGVTSNVNTHANKFTSVSHDYNDWASITMDSSKNIVSYNWKSFDMATMSWTVDDSTVFFIADNEGDIYKLYFTFWEGASTGNFAFYTDMVSLSDIDESEITVENFSIFPIPAKEIINIKSLTENNKFSYKIMNISGRTILTGKSTGTTSINTESFSSGTYIVFIKNSEQTESHLIIIN